MGSEDQVVLLIREEEDIFPTLLRHCQGRPLGRKDWLSLTYHYMLRVPASEVHRTAKGWRQAISRAIKTPR